MNTGSKTVLLVEDDYALREALTEWLKDEGFEVTAASDGQDALNWLAEAPRMPTVIVTDLLMPNVDGWQLWQQLSAQSLWNGIPVIVLSSAIESRPWPNGRTPAAQFRKPPDLGKLLMALQHVTSEPARPVTHI